MTSASVWNPTLLDDTVGATDLRIKQLPTTPVKFTNDFYNLQGEIIVQKSDIEIDLVDSGNSTNSKPTVPELEKKNKKFVMNQKESA